MLPLKVVDFFFRNLAFQAGLLMLLTFRTIGRGSLCKVDGTMMTRHAREWAPFKHTAHHAGGIVCFCEKNLGDKNLEETTLPFSSVHASTCRLVALSGVKRTCERYCEARCTLLPFFQYQTSLLERLSDVYIYFVNFFVIYFGIAIFAESTRSYELSNDAHWQG